MGSSSLGHRNIQHHQTDNYKRNLVQSLLKLSDRRGNLPAVSAVSFLTACACDGANRQVIGTYNMVCTRVYLVQARYFFDPFN